MGCIVRGTAPTRRGTVRATARDSTSTGTSCVRLRTSPFAASSLHQAHPIARETDRHADRVVRNIADRAPTTAIVTPLLDLVGEMTAASFDASTFDARSLMPSLKP